MIKYLIHHDQQTTENAQSGKGKQLFKEIYMLKERFRIEIINDYAQGRIEALINTCFPLFFLVTITEVYN